MRLRFQSEIRLGDLGDLANRSNDWARTVPLLGVVFCLVVYFAAIFFEAMLSFNRGVRLHDYDGIYGSLFAWSHHMNPYLVYPFTPRGGLNIRGLYVWTVNLNPPISLYLFRPIVVLGLSASAQTWTIVSVLLFVASLALIVRANPNPYLRTRILMVLGMTAVWQTFREGQIYMILLLLATIAWLALKKSNLLIAGVSIGLLCALKPNFLVWPVLLVLARHRKAGISAVVTVAAVSMVPLVFGNGVQLYRLWAEACKGFKGFELPANSAIPAMFARLDPYNASHHFYGDVGYALAIGLLLFAAWLAWQRAPDTLRTSGVALIVTLLVGPISWVGYTVVLVPMLYERQLNALMRIGWVILCIPMVVLYYISTSSSLLFILMGSPYFYGIVLIGATIVHEVYQEREEEPNHPEGGLAPRESALCTRDRELLVQETH